MWNHNGVNWYSEEELADKQREIDFLTDTLKACEKEYRALAQRYHELQAESNATYCMRKEV